MRRDERLKLDNRFLGLVLLAERQRVCVAGGGEAGSDAQAMGENDLSLLAAISPTESFGQQPRGAEIAGVGAQIDAQLGLRVSQAALAQPCERRAQVRVLDRHPNEFVIDLGCCGLVAGEIKLLAQQEPSLREIAFQIGCAAQRHDRPVAFARHRECDAEFVVRFGGLRLRSRNLGQDELGGGEIAEPPPRDADYQQRPRILRQNLRNFPGLPLSSRRIALQQLDGVGDSFAGR